MTNVLFLRNKTHVDSHASRAVSYRCGVQHAAGTQMAVSYPTVFLAASLSLSPKVVSPAPISLGVKRRFLWLSAHSLLHVLYHISSVIPRRFARSLHRYQLVCSNFPKWWHLWLSLMACDVSEPAPTLGASKQTYRVSRVLLTKKHRWFVMFSRNPEASKLLLYSIFWVIGKTHFSTWRFCSINCSGSE